MAGQSAPECPEVGIDQEQGVVAAQLGRVVRQSQDRTIAGLTKARVRMLHPGGELDVLVAHQGVAQELHFRRRPARDQEHADLLADHLTAAVATLSSMVSSGPASSTLARNSY